MEKYKTTFKEIFQLTAEGRTTRRSCREVAPIDEATLSMMVEHLPTPKEAQPYRIPHLWHGDLNTEDGKAMMTVDQKAKANIVVFGISMTRTAGRSRSGGSSPGP